MKTRQRLSNIQRVGLYHRFFRSSGFYRFLLKNSLRVILIVASILGLIYGIEHFLIHNLREDLLLWLKQLPNFGVWLVFSLSESLLGLIPPDIFIVWSKNLGNSYFTVLLLGIVSYAAGFISYFIGYYFAEKKRFQDHIKLKYGKFIKQLRQWGGLLIIIAALLPLPYSAICMISGMVKYPISKLWYFGLFRILRFVLYAIFLFKMF